MNIDIKHYLRANSLEVSTAVTEVKKDAIDTRDNYANQLSDLVLILNSDDPDYFRSQVSQVRLEVGDQYTLLQDETGDGNQVCYSLCRTNTFDFSIKKQQNGQYVNESPLMVNGELQNFNEEAELFFEDEVSGIKFNFKNYLNSVKDGIVQSDLLNSVCDCYRNLSNRLGLFSQLAKGYYETGSLTIRNFIDQVHVGLAQVATSPRGFLNFVRGLLDDVKRKFRDTPDGAGLNETDYSVQPYAWSGLAQLIGTIASTILAAVRNAVGAIVGVIAQVLSMIFTAFKDAWDSLEPDWKVNGETDNYLASIPIFQQVYSDLQYRDMLDRVFSYDTEEGRVQYAVYEELYDALFAAENHDRILSFDFLWFHFLIWPHDAGDNNWKICIEVYINTYGMNQPRGNTSLGPGYQYYWGWDSIRPGDTSIHIGIWPWANYKPNFLRYVSSEIDTILAPNEMYNTRSANYRVAMAVTNALYMSCVFGYHDGIPNSQVTKDQLEDLSDGYDDTSNPTIYQYYGKILYTLYTSTGVDPEVAINDVIYGVMRKHPELFLENIKMILSRFGYIAESDSDISSRLVHLACVQRCDVISNHDFFAYPPKFGSAAKSTLIWATVATAAVGIGVAIGATVASVKIKGYMTKQYAKVQQAQTKMAEATTDDQLNTAYKDFKKARKKYNLIATLTGNAKLSSVNGWEESSDPVDAETYGQSNSIYDIMPTYSDSLNVSKSNDFSAERILSVLKR